ncbi:BA75_00846T0 [Komagataella pastoris]|uniref:BA75_00846T0 n=1 Tax=Komagataella pastoris TaxID=4922 RepID=A0A1B2J7V5_PICPA|nr:BA75_00846T0 [Komagataella pastoris]
MSNNLNNNNPNPPIAPGPNQVGYTSSLRSPASPALRARQASIVELLSTPPPIEPSDASIDNTLNLSRTASNLSRNPSSSSQTSSMFAQQHQQQQHQQFSTSGAGSSSTSGLMDWQNIELSALVEENKLIFINENISVEEAFDTLVKNNLTSLPVEKYRNDLDCLTFDYADLNSYLLLVLNRIRSERLLSINYEPREDIPDLIQKAQKGEQVPVKFVIQLINKNPFIKLHESETLSTVVEILGNGVHRIAIMSDTQITGILSQRRLIKYLWDNARKFHSLDPLLGASLAQLNIGSTNVVSIYGDQLLIEALSKMHELMISSMAVVDKHHNLLGNISVTDVKHVSKSSQSPLLYKSCLHFVSYILNLKGLENGKDSFPIFHVTPNSSLSRTMAKLVATKSHRLWIVNPVGAEDPIIAGSSIPLSPSSSLNGISSSNNSNLSIFTPEKDMGRPGKLIGVVSITDILSLLARRLGKSHVDPSTARKQRRRSSSSSSRSVASRSSLEQFRKSVSDASDR